MAVKIRLQRHGRKKAPFYHIVIADSRSPRDGRFIEKIGTYNPMTRPATIDLDREAAYSWLMKGAQPTDTARAILRFKGVMYRKHLQRGINKGALTEDKAMKMYQEWIEKKEKTISDRFAQTAAEKKAFQELVFGKPKAKAAPVIEEAPAPVVEETPAPDVVEETPVAETPIAEVAETVAQGTDPEMERMIEASTETPAVTEGGDTTTSDVE